MSRYHATVTLLKLLVQVVTITSPPVSPTDVSTVEGKNGLFIAVNMSMFALIYSAVLDVCFRMKLVNTWFGARSHSSGVSHLMGRQGLFRKDLRF